MLSRRPVFPGVIEMNHQAGWRIGCNVYLVYDDDAWALVDIGYSESVDEIIEMIRQLDFPLAQCQALIAVNIGHRHRFTLDADGVGLRSLSRGIVTRCLWPMVAHAW